MGASKSTIAEHAARDAAALTNDDIRSDDVEEAVREARELKERAKEEVKQMGKDASYQVAKGVASLAKDGLKSDIKDLPSKMEEKVKDAGNTIKGMINDQWDSRETRNTRDTSRDSSSSRDSRDSRDDRNIKEKAEDKLEDLGKEATWQAAKGVAGLAKDGLIHDIKELPKKMEEKVAGAGRAAIGAVKSMTGLGSTEDVKDTVKDSMKDMKDKAEDKMHDVKDAAYQTKDNVMHEARDLSKKVEDKMGTLGGASRIARDTMKSVSDLAKEDTNDISKKVEERVAGAAKSAIGAVKDATGLSEEDLQRQFRDLPKKAEQAYEGASKAVRDVTGMSKEDMRNIEQRVVGASKQAIGVVKDATGMPSDQMMRTLNLATEQKRSAWKAGIYGAMGGSVAGAVGVGALGWMRPRWYALDRFMFRYRSFPLLAVMGSSAIGAYVSAVNAKAGNPPVYKQLQNAMK